MRRRLAASVAAFALALSGSTIAIAAEHADAIACAEREVLLTVLVEAHGAAPNAASEILAAETEALTRAACDGGNVHDAVALYDRLIAQLTASLAQDDD